MNSGLFNSEDSPLPTNSTEHIALPIRGLHRFVAIAGLVVLIYYFWGVPGLTWQYSSTSSDCITATGFKHYNRKMPVIFFIARDGSVWPE